MAIAAYPATIKLGANIVNDIITYDLPFKMDMVETTAFSGSGGAAIGNKTYIPTLLGTQIKCAGSWNKTDTLGQLALETAFFARTTVALVASPNGTNTYSVTCWVSDYGIKLDTKTKVDVDFTLQTNGSVVLA